jgi:nucleotide-binding universal stress UspA family protein
MRDTSLTRTTAVYDRIVVPLDGSELAESALPHAVTIARGIHRPIHLIRIVDITPLTLVSPVGLGAEQAAWFTSLNALEAEEEVARDYLKAIKQRIAEEGLVVTWEVERGMVAPTLLDRVKSADLLTMTTHGRTGLRRWFFGNVAEELIRRSAAAVLLVRVREDDKDQEQLDKERT